MFPNLDTVDILAWGSLRVSAVLYTVLCLAEPLASTSQMSIAIAPPHSDKLECLQILPTVPWGNKIVSVENYRHTGWFYPAYFFKVFLLGFL